MRNSSKDAYFYIQNSVERNSGEVDFQLVLLYVVQVFMHVCVYQNCYCFLRLLLYFFFNYKKAIIWQCFFLCVCVENLNLIKFYVTWIVYLFPAYLESEDVSFSYLLCSENVYSGTLGIDTFLFNMPRRVCSFFSPFFLSVCWFAQQQQLWS